MYFSNLITIIIILPRVLIRQSSSLVPRSSGSDELEQLGSPPEFTNVGLQIKHLVEQWVWEILFGERLLHAVEYFNSSSTKFQGAPCLIRLIKGEIKVSEFSIEIAEPNEQLQFFSVTYPRKTADGPELFRVHGHFGQINKMAKKLDLLFDEFALSKLQRHAWYGDYSE